MSIEQRQNIYQAEHLRAAGNLDTAWDLIKGSFINPSIIDALPDSFLSDHIRQWRIGVSIKTSLAQRVWTARGATGKLAAAGNIIRNYYHHPAVQVRALDFLTDNEGHPYNFAAEMLRDEGKYFSVAFYISGNFQFLTSAIIAYERTIEHAQLDSSKGLAMIELGQAKKMKNELLRKPRESVYETYISPGFDLIRDTKGPQDLDRLFWVLTTVIRESSLSPHANLSNLNQLCAESLLEEHFGKCGAGKFILKSDLKILGLNIHKKVWGATRNRLDFSSLI